MKPSRGGPRRLTDDEIELWTAAAQSVARRRGANLPVASRPKPPPTPPVQPTGDAHGTRMAESAQTRPSGPPPLAPLEKRLKRDLQRGRAAIDAALDLHGLNQAEAHHALRHFLFASQARGAKVVIIVTGKGKAGQSASSWIDEPGVLRRLAPHWLREADLRSVVLGFEEAGRAHGGAGALYVRLRRRMSR